MLIIIITNYVIFSYLILSSFMQLLPFPSYFQFHASHHIHLSLIISYISCSSSFILMYSYHVYLHHSYISYHVHIPCQSYHVHLIHHINTIMFHYHSYASCCIHVSLTFMISHYIHSSITFNHSSYMYVISCHVQSIPQSGTTYHDHS